MQLRVISEHLALDGGVLRLRVRADVPLLTATLSVPGGARVKVAPLLAAGAEQASSIDLAALADGVFAVAARSAAGAEVVLGRQFAGQVTARPDGVWLVARSSFARPGGALTTALLYVDPQTRGVRLRILPAEAADAFLAEIAAGADAAQKPIRYSVISPVYNVEKYLDDFFESVTSQSLAFKAHIELIMVDDGSTDHSAKIINRWQRKFPANIRIVQKQNGGISSARNAGLAVASHDWITFIDPDDFISPDYFKRVDETLRRHGEDWTALVSCAVVHYLEATRTLSDHHPLRFRFAAGERAVSVDALDRDFQITVCGGFWRRDIVVGNALAFDGRIRPGSEDAHFSGRYLLRADGKSLIFQPGATYHHRRRKDQSSLSQTGWTKPESYDDELRFGYLPLLREAREREGRVPTFIQNMVLYCLSWALRRAVDEPGAVSFLTADQRRTYLDLLRETFSFIDVETIAAFRINMPMRLRAGIIGLFKNAEPPPQTIEIGGLDSGRGLFRAACWSRELDPGDSYRVDDALLVPAFRKARRLDLLGTLFVYEHIRWLPLPATGTVQVSVGGRPADITVAGRPRHDKGIAASDIRTALAPTAPPEAQLPAIARDVRAAARTPQAEAAFRDAWLFMDRDSEADDNAEHLYRHVRAHAPDINAYFILARASPHWERLAADGFRLLAFNEPEHAVALLNAAHLISSQADHYVLDYLGRAEFGDRLRYRFTFLQHGVTQADFADWFNRLPIDCLTTSSFHEHESFVADGTRYTLSRKEAVLTGLPRHDVLLHGPVTDGRTIVIMPTWRQSLSGMTTGAGNARAVNAAFYNSEFAERWKSFLHAPQLAKIAGDAGCRIVFLPHPNLTQYLDFFSVPANIEVRTFGGGASIQPLFRQLSAFVTDYSSKAFDVAYLDKPVLYYQFDPDVYFGGGHMARRGDFDFVEDGFGPVCGDEETMLTALESALEHGGVADTLYRQRAARTFAFRDGGSCARVLAAVRNLDRAVETADPVDLQRAEL